MSTEKERFGLKELGEIVRSRRERPCDGSYTAMLIKKGAGHVCRKLQEEVLEAILESHDGHRERLVSELSDLLYHALVLGSCHDVFLEDIEKCLASRHRSAITAEADVFGKLQPYESSESPAPLATLIERSKCDVLGGADVVLFSPSVLGDASASPEVYRIFPSETKALKTFFQEHDVKVKMGVGTDEEVRHAPRRRSTELMLPIIYVVNAVLVPVCVKLLADYLKKIIDKVSGDKKTPVGEETTQVWICVTEERETKTRWFRFEGGLERVHGQMKSVADDGA